MSDDRDPSEVINRSGGADIDAGRDTTIGGDVVGRDKVQSAGGHIVHAEAGHSWKYHFYFLSPQDFPIFFEVVKTGGTTLESWKSSLMLELISAQSS
jgi:hypothetical protein